MLDKYKVFCRFVTKEMVKEGFISEFNIIVLNETIAQYLIAGVIIFELVYGVSPLLFSFCLLQWFGQTVVTVPLTIIMAFVAFDNVKNFVNTLKDTYNDAANNTTKHN